MGKFIVALDHPETKERRYIEWSTVVDAPITYGMTREEFAEYYQEEYGRVGLKDFDERMARVDAKGTSSRMHASASEVMECNRAGPKETKLSYGDIVREYFSAPESITSTEGQ